MNMTGNDVAVRMRDRVMSEHKRSHSIRRVDTLEAQLGWGITGTAIMIATHERYFDIAARAAPGLECGEHFLRPSRLRVQ